MVPKAVLVVVAVFSWVVTAAITVGVLTFGPGAPPDVPPGVPQWRDAGPGAQLTQADPAPDAVLPRYGLLPVFTLTDQDGQPFGLNDLRGKVWVVDTIFTRCTAICPTLTGGMKQIQSALKPDGQFDDRVRLVSISLDGGYDSSEVLKKYAKAYKAEPGRWIFLTGDRAEVWPLVQDGMKLPVEQADPGDDMAILHSGKLLLIDKAGVVRGYYDGLNEAGRIELLTDLQRLLSEG